MFHVKQWSPLGRRTILFTRSRERAGNRAALLADAEAAEEGVQHVFGAGPSGNGIKSATRRADLERARAGYQDAVVYDTAIAAVLGVVAAAGLITGTALLVAANLE